jgi:hypothetical protein
MNDTQLYLAIGVPIVFNALGFTLLILYIQSTRDLLRAELRRVEEVLDARLKHLEERIEHR